MGDQSKSHLNTSLCGTFYPSRVISAYTVSVLFDKMLRLSDDFCIKFSFNFRLWFFFGFVGLTSSYKAELCGTRNVGFRSRTSRFITF